MLKYLIVGALTVFLLIFTPTSAAMVKEPKPEPENPLILQEEIKPKSNEEIVEELVEKYATKYGVSKERMWRTIRCENSELDFDLQSRIINSKGIREQSYGISQIHLPSNPSVSYEEATNPEFAVEFMAKNFAAGRASMWSCYRKIYAK